MRCTRCDRWAVPQAVGQTPDGVLVFGWCLDCLKETGCTEVEVARQIRGTRLPTLHELERTSRPASDSLLERRTRIVTLVASMLAVWGLCLLSAGGWLLQRVPAGRASPFGNGTPVLLLVGGGVTTATALVLGMTIVGRVSLRGGRPTLRVVRWASFLMALASLLLGILDHVPQRDPYLVLTAGLALAVATLARRLERSRRPRSFSPNQETPLGNRPNIGR